MVRSESMSLPFTRCPPEIIQIMALLITEDNTLDSTIQSQRTEDFIELCQGLVPCHSLGLILSFLRANRGDDALLLSQDCGKMQESALPQNIPV